MTGQLSQARLAALLQRRSAHRFRARELEEMRGVWRVLVRDFFLKRIRPGVPVLDVGAGACLFVNEVVASRRIALDANPDLRRHAAPGVEVLQTNDQSLAPRPDGSTGHDFGFVDHGTTVTDTSLREARELAGLNRLPPAPWLLGRQTFVEAFKPRGAGPS